MAAKNESLEKQAQNVTAEFVSSLGLTDITLGSLFLYGRYAAVPLTATQLPSSGYAVVDVGLLLCAAALVGKIISLAIAFVMAGVEAGIERVLYREELLSALMAARPNMSEADAKRRPLASAMAFARAADPPTEKLLKQIENQSVLAYGAALLSLLFATGYRGVTAGLVPAVLLILFAVAFLALGFFQQVDYFVQAIEFLKTAETGGGTNMTETIRIHVDTTGEIGVSDAARFLLALNALHVAVMLTDEEHKTKLAAELKTLELPTIDILNPAIQDDKVFGALAAVNSLAPQQAADALEFVKLRSGSLSGAVREVWRKVFGNLATMTATLPSLLPGQDGKAFVTAVAQVQGSAGDASEFRRTAMIAGANFRVALQNMNATGVETT